MQIMLTLCCKLSFYCGLWCNNSLFFC